MQRSLIVFSFVALALAMLVSFSAATAQQAGDNDVMQPSRYSVVETDGLHLIVADQQANVLYFYAVEPGGQVGEDLMLRGSIDLKDVGKPSLKPMIAD